MSTMDPDNNSLGLFMVDVKRATKNILLFNSVVCVMCVFGVKRHATTSYIIFFGGLRQQKNESFVVTSV